MEESMNTKAPEMPAELHLRCLGWSCLWRSDWQAFPLAEWRSGRNKTSEIQKYKIK